MRTLYKLAGREGQDGARDRIASIVSQFISFQQLQRPFIQGFQDVAKVAAKYSEIEREATVLRTAVGERDATVAAGNVRAAAVEGRLAEALAEIEQQRVQIAELARERNALAGSLEAARAELAAELVARTAAEERSHSEQLALLRTLAAAREVGSAALASLRIETALVPQAPRNTGCLTRFIRFFSSE